MTTYRVTCNTGFIDATFFFSKIASVRDFVYNLPYGTVSFVAKKVKREPTGNEIIDQLYGDSKWKEISL